MRTANMKHVAVTMTPNCVAPHLLVWLCLLFLAAISIGIARAETVTLEWDPVQDGRVHHYNIYYGSTSGQYQNRLQTKQASARIEELEPGQYYFAVRACDAEESVCSDHSNEISTIVEGGTTASKVPLTGGLQYRSPPVGAKRQSAAISLGSSANEAGSQHSKSIQGFDAGFPFEIGSVSVGHDWVRVSFHSEFQEPIVIAKGLSANARSPAIIRTKDVDGKGFSVRVQAWDYLSDMHASETVNYLVVERGRHQLANGAWVEAGSFATDITAGFQQRHFGSVFPSTPVVFTAVVSSNEEDAVNARAKDVTADGFMIGLVEQEANQQRHATEQVDYIAWEASSGEIAGIRYEVALTERMINHTPQTVSFSKPFAETPVLIVDQQSVHDSEPASIRWTELGKKNVRLWVEEERSADAGIVHAAEQLGYFSAAVADSK